MNFDLKKNTILLTVVGSTAYNMALPESDIDLKGVLICPKKYYLGFVDHFEQADKPEHMKPFYDCLTPKEKIKANNGDVEGSIYELRKFFKLASACNPNILDVLFCRDEEIRYITPLGKKLRENRDLFLSTKVKFVYSGYSFSQLMRIQRKRNYFINPPKSKPQRKDFGLLDEKIISNNEIQAIEAAIQKKIDSWEIDFSNLDNSQIIYIQEQLQNYMLELKLGSEEKFIIAAKSVGCDDNFIDIMKRERQYKIKRNEWRSYQNWLQNRNPERAAMEKKYGYDGKHASHLVRLLLTCREILETGKVNVWRENADELLAIRNGAWTYQQLIDFAEKEDKELSELYKTSKLPKYPNKEKLDKLCVEMIEDFYEKSFINHL